MRIRRLELVLVTAALSGLAASAVVVPASGGREATSAAKGVSVRDDVFSPRGVTVSRGGKVTWRWRGENPHNVAFRRVPAGASRPKRCGTTSRRGASCTRKFPRRGTYRYVCTIHELAGMKGRVKVE
jgi:plastocyanin